MLINRLYRTRVQIGYEPGNEPGSRSGAKGKSPSYAYAGSDAAEISPLAIVLYGSGQKADGTFEDLSERFIRSPFANEQEDYSHQAKKLFQQQTFGNGLTKEFSLQTLKAEAQEREARQSGEQAAAYPSGFVVKAAYLQASATTVPAYQQMINVAA